MLYVPKRLRYYLQHGPKVQNFALHIFMSAIEQALRRSSPGAGPDARCGAVVFIHRFGALLNEHLHFHCVVLEGVFSGGEDGQAVFHPASDLHAPAFDQAQSAVRRRLLKAQTRRGVLEEEEAQGRLNWQRGGGFSLICPKCGGEMKIIAFINAKDVVQKILKHLGMPPEPPKLAKAGYPPLWELQASGIEEFDPMVQVMPDYEFDQRIVW